MFYRIDAVDTLFFRSPAPFDAELNYEAGSLFPPLPSAYAGALLGQAGEEKRAGTVKIGFSGLLLRGGDGVEQIYFPKPLDLAEYEKKLHPMKLRKLEAVSNYPFSRVLRPEKITAEKTAVKDSYISLSEMQKYLSGNAEPIEQVSLGEYYTSESNTGIQINAVSRAVIGGRMYSTKKIRPEGRDGQGASLLFEDSGEGISQPSILRMGGEGKLVQARPCREGYTLPKPGGSENCFKLCLATPAIFQNGWLPGWITQEDFTGFYAHRQRRIRVQLICAAVGRLVPAGGFSYSGLRPKPLLYAVPAGSVYYFKILEGTFADAVTLFHGKCVSDYRDSLGFTYRNRPKFRYCDRGFGYALVGKFDDLEGK